MNIAAKRLSLINKWIIEHKKGVNQIVFVLTLIFIAELITAIIVTPEKREFPKFPVSISEEIPTPTSIPEPTLPPATPTPSYFTLYKKPTLAKTYRYDVYLVGDSMTHAFGPRGGKFTENLSAAYPANFFEVSNYGQAAKSIIDLPNILKEQYQADKDLLLKPILEATPKPNLIIIESFGYNPLSQFSRAEGLKKQEEILTQVLTELTKRFPNTAIMFLTAIAPDKRTYAAKINKTTVAERFAQAEERIEFITNHRKYAREHNIPLADAYQESLDASGDGDTKYINADDNIHPSEEGLALMGRVITQSIKEENIFPQ
jgi:lysophospholipase L1-like esterase